MSPTAPLFLAAALAAPTMAPDVGDHVARALIGHAVWLQSGNAFDEAHAPRVMEVLTGREAAPRPFDAAFGSDVSTAAPARAVFQPNTAPIRFVRPPSDG